ncbi:MAG: hypothetical protein R3270_08770 [Gammaproteobacteria bacterium]|nr:hypothetical protein [Gammaproteobacteria bacterium]
MKSILVAALVAASTLATSPAAQAGPFTDELSRCLVRNTTDADRTQLIKWIYIAMSQHPKVSALAEVSASDAEKANEQTAALFMDLITNRCKSEAKDAIQYDGQVAFQQSFSVLGQVAMQGIMADPGVATYMGGLDKYLDEEKFEEAFGTQPSNP